mgnify:CR=1 FL=1
MHLPQIRSKKMRRQKDQKRKPQNQDNFLKNTKDNQLFDPQNANPSYSQDTKFKKINE